MQNLYDEVGSLDQRCYEEFGLSEDILMENAAANIAMYIKKHFPLQSCVLVVSGSGNNGADGITLARILHQDYKIKLFLAKEAKSPMAKLQLQRAKAIGVEIVSSLDVKTDVIVDAILGTGFNGTLPQNFIDIIEHLNQIKAYKIACDIPSGLRSDGVIAQTCFKADVTITMGGLKKSLYLDMAKDYVGKIIVADLGLARSVYEVKSSWQVLDESDMKLPLRDKEDAHKGRFGHSCIVSGEKTGASVLCGMAALKVGCALITLYTKRQINIPYSLMQSSTITQNTTAIAIGMGLGEEDAIIEELLQKDIPFVIDADMFYKKEIVSFLEKKQVIITPHPKEFVSLLALCDIATISTKELQEKRFYYVELFTQKYPNVVLVLKGANVIIGYDTEFFVNPHGTNVLAKAGSGDVLAGIITGLVAQGYTPLQAAISGSLIHTSLAKRYTKNNFSLDPQNLITLLEEL